MNWRLITAGASALSLAVGAAAGYLVARKRLELEYDRRLNDEVGKTKAHLNGLAKKGLDLRHPAPPEGIEETEAERQANENHGAQVFLEQLIENRGYGGGALTDNIRLRKPQDGPSLIDEEEYMANESGLPQVTLTYYAGDDTLADDEDDIVEDPARWVGLEHLKLLHADCTTIYIHNPTTGADYEIVLSEGRYAVEVLGQE